MKKIIITLLITTLFTLSACNRFGEDNLPKPTALQAFSPSVTSTQLWSHSVGRGDLKQNLRFAMGMVETRLFTTDAAGHIEATDALTGRTLWSKNLKSTVSSGLAISDSLIAVVGDDATLYVLEQSNGAIRWTAALINQALAVPTITQDKIFVKTIDEQVSAFDVSTGKEIWTFASDPQQLILRFGSSPIAINDKVIVGTGSGKIFALNAADGLLLWEQIIAVPKGITDVQQMVDIDMNPLVEKGVIYVASYQGNLVALELESGIVLWHKEFSSFTGMAIQENNLYITDAQSHLWQLDKLHGLVQWKQDKLAYRAVTSPVVVGQFVVLADKEGYIHILSADTGDLAARIQVAKNSILSAPMASNNRLYVLTQEGKLSAYTLDNLKK